MATYKPTKKLTYTGSVGRTNTGKTSMTYTGKMKPPTPTAPAQTMTPEQQKYVKNLGYKPSELPEFFSEQPENNILQTISKGLGRLGSGFNKFYANAYADVGRMQAGDPKNYLARAFIPVNLAAYAKDFAEGALGNTDYSRNVSATREVIENPKYQKEVIEPLSRLDNIIKIGNLKTAKDSFEDPTLQYLSQNISGLMDPVSTLAMNKTAQLAGKGVKIAGKAVASTPVIQGLKKELYATLENYPRLSKAVARTFQSGVTKEATGAISRGKGEIKLAEDTAVALGEVLKGNKSKTIRAFLDNGLRRLLGEKAEKAIFAIDDMGKIKLRPDSGKKIFEKISNPQSKIALTASEIAAKNAIVEINKNIGQELVNKGLLKKEALEKFSSGYIPYFYKNTGEEIIPRKVGEAFGSELNRTKARLEPVERILKAVESGNPKLKNVLNEKQIADLTVISEAQKESANKLQLLEQIIAADKEPKPALVKMANDLKIELGSMGKKVRGVVGNLAETDLKLARNIGLVDDALGVVPKGFKQELELLAKTDMAKGIENAGVTYKNVFEASKATGLPTTFYSVLPNEAKYGTLAGKTVPVAIKRVLEGTYAPTTEGIGKLLSVPLDYWKKLKLFVVANTPTSFRNFLTGFLQAGMGGYDPLTYGKNWEKGALMYDRGKGKYLNEFIQESGGSLGFLNNTSRTYKKAENIVNNPLGKVINKLDEIVNEVPFKGKRIPLTPIGFGQKSFQEGDTLNRFAVYITERDRGKTASEAMSIAKKVMYDYDKIPQVIEDLDKYGIPFVRFTYSAAMAAIDTAVKNPAFYYKGDRIIKTVESQAGKDEELPSYVKEKRWAYVKLPKEFGKNKYIDLTSIVPYAQGLTNETSIPKNPEQLAEFLALQNPFVKTVVELKTNQRLLNGTPIVKSGLADEEANQARSNYALTQLGPSGVLSPTGTMTAKELITKEPQMIYSNEKNLVDNLLRYTIGMRATTVDPVANMEINLSKAQKQVDEFNSRITNLQKYSPKGAATTKAIFNIRKQRDEFIANSPYKRQIKNRAK